MKEKHDLPFFIRLFLCSLFASLCSTSSASTLDALNGTISIPCLQTLKNGVPTNKFFFVEIVLTGNDSMDVKSIGGLGSDFSGCSATFDVVTLLYVDKATYNLGDAVTKPVEIRGTFIKGKTLSLDSLLTRTNHVTRDISIKENGSMMLDLPPEIDAASVELSLENTGAVPDFISLVGNSLVVEPRPGDAGEYDLRLVWDFTLENIEITVSPETGGADIDVSMLPASLPAFSDLNLYAGESPFNNRVPFDAAVDPASDVLVESIRDSKQLSVVVGQFSSPVFFADSSTPRTEVEIACGAPWEIGISAMTGVPLPNWAVPANDVDGGEAPVGCGVDSGRDNFMVVLDLDNRCEYDLWQARREGDKWVASYGVGMSLDGNGISPKGMSARGSGFAFLGGVIWPDELVRGRIDHVLAFSYDFTKAGGPVAPATDSDGITESDKAIPEGALVQLDPAFDLNSLNLEPYELTIARAMQEYGMLLVDTGGAGGPVGFYAIDPDSVSGQVYDQIWGNEDFIVLENLDVATLPLRVLSLGVQDSDWQDTLAPFTGSSCNAYQ